jgi:hypothetical protein
VQPIPIDATGVGQLVAGDVAELAGYGLTESQSSGSLRFLVERIVSIDSGSITVNGFGASGACLGDSGGPLLVRTPDGTLTVAGVLSAGSETCTADDHYVRLDALGSWVASLVSASPPTDRECGTIGAQGRCLYGSAMWCANAQLEATPCTGDQSCGWDPGASGFRCVARASDPCAGVDSVGRCVGDTASWCNAGMLELSQCGPCGDCNVEGTTGGPICVARPGDAGGE